MSSGGFVVCGGAISDLSHTASPFSAKIPIDRWAAT